MSLVRVRGLWIVFCFLASEPAFGLTVDVGVLDAYANHNAFVAADRKMSMTGALLGLLNHDSLHIDKSSSRPLASIVMLYDGNPGALADVDNTFLRFDGVRAVITLKIADWRRPDRVAFTAMEPIDQPAQVRLTIAARNRVVRRLPLTRTVVETRGTLARVEYAISLGSALPGGELRLDYKVRGVSNARLGAFILDDVGRPEVPPHPQRNVSTVEDWKALFGSSRCAQVRQSYAQVRQESSRKILNLLLGDLNRGFPSKLVFWHEVPDQERGYSTHSLLLKVDKTGNTMIDFVRAWLVIPNRHRARLSLVILPQQGHIYGALEPLGVLGEKELSIGAELARQGIASLAFDSYPFGTPFVPYQLSYYQYYPYSGSTAKDLDNLRRLLDQVLDASFQARAKVAFDTERIGIWGFSYGAWISLLTAVMDDRIRAVAFSSFHYHDRDIAHGLSASLYLPTLACVEGLGDTPISVRRMLREYRRNTLAVVPDIGLLEEWAGGLEDARVTVAVNPFGHLVTEYERAAVLNFFYDAFSIRAKATSRGVSHDLPRNAAQLAPYVARENLWRAKLIEALAPK